MTLAAEADHSLAVETTAFLGACVGFVVLLVVVALYLSRKWYFTPPATNTALFGGVCVPLGESNNDSVAQNLGKNYTFPDPETSSDSEEDALRRLNSRNHLPPDTLTIQAEDELPSIQDAVAINNNNNNNNNHNVDDCAEEGSVEQLCIVEVGSTTNILDNRENEPPTIDENVVASTPTDTITSLSSSIDEMPCLEIAFLYDAPMREMTIHVLQGRNFPAGIGSQVRLVLLPSKKQRRKTRVRQGSSPHFVESFLLPRVNPEDVNAMGVRVRVYLWGGRMRRERLLGEARVSFDRMNLRLETSLWLTLQPPPSAQDWGTMASLTRSDSTGSQQSVQSYALPTYTPPYGSSMKGGSIAEILIGLSYNGITGLLSIEIIKGSHFRVACSNEVKAPDTYVKLALVDSNGYEMGRAKTGLRRAQTNPLFKETFIFQVALFQLGDVSLYMSIYNRRRTAMGKKGREMIGWLCLGLGSSGPEELQHWNDMRAVRPNQQVQRWHSLHRP